MPVHSLQAAKAPDARPQSVYHAGTPLLLPLQGGDGEVKAVQQLQTFQQALRPLRVVARPALETQEPREASANK